MPYSRVFRSQFLKTIVVIEISTLEFGKLEYLARVSFPYNSRFCFFVKVWKRIWVHIIKYALRETELMLEVSWVWDI